MRAEKALRLYPRAWRDHYGEEFLATVGPAPLGLQQVIDIAFGALDAWLSSDVRRATATTNRGATMTIQRFARCVSTPARYTLRDAVAAAAVMLVATSVFVALGGVAGRHDWPLTATVLKNFSFLAALILSMPLWITRGQPWKAQAVLIGTTLLFLAGIGYLG